MKNRYEVREQLSGGFRVYDNRDGKNLYGCRLPFGTKDDAQLALARRPKRYQCELCADPAWSEPSTNT